MVHYKLIYFNLRGRAEPLRLIFHYAGVPFEDARVEREQWPALKEKTPYGQVPVLEVDGQPIAQANAIAHFLARKFGLEGKNEVETAQIDAQNELLVDFGNKSMPYLAILAGFRPGDKEKTYKDFKDALAVYAPLIEKALSKAGNGYLNACGITWVDFTVASFTYLLQKMCTADLEPYTPLKQHSARIHALPQLKEYLANRPDVF